MMRKYFLKKTLVCGIIISFICLVIAPNVNCEKIKTKSKNSDSEPFNPFLSGWFARKTVTIKHEKIQENLTDFPLLISVVDSDLAAKIQDDGDDILFMDSKGKANKLCHEIELFNSSSGKLVVWVKIPHISSSSDTKIEMYFRNSKCDNQQEPADVWTTNYKGVWHMNSGTNNNQGDSTINNHILSHYGSPTSVEGKIGYAVDLNGLSDYFTYPADTDFLMGAGSFTIAAWVKADNDAKDDDGRVIVYKGSDGPTHTHAYAFWNVRQGTGFSAITIDDNTVAKAVFGISDLSDGMWHYIVGARDQDKIKIWVDGILEGSTYIGNYGSLDGAGRLYVGRGGIEARYLKGVLDDLIIIKGVAKSDGWIATSYNNQNDPSGFYTVSRESTKSYNENYLGVLENLQSYLFRLPFIKHLFGV